MYGIKYPWPLVPDLCNVGKHLPVNTVQPLRSFEFSNIYSSSVCLPGEYNDGVRGGSSVYPRVRVPVNKWLSLWRTFPARWWGKAACSYLIQSCYSRTNYDGFQEHSATRLKHSLAFPWGTQWRSWLRKASGLISDEVIGFFSYLILPAAVWL